jgi:thioredoxin reductase (NADPH)
MVDLIIVGAGPVGLACGIEARRAGLVAQIIEKGALINSFLGYPTNLEFFSTPDLLEIGGHPFPTQRYKPIREEAIDYYRRLAEAERLDVHLYERVLHAEGEAGNFVVQTTRARYRTRFIIVATGFFDQPNMMGVPGEDLPKVTHYYKEPFGYSGQDVAIIGAKNSAAKAALDCYRHGARVTLLVRGPALSPSIKYWIKPDLENRIAEGSIAAFFNVTVRSIEPDVIVIETPDGVRSLKNDWVLAMTGYRPNYDFLEALGIAFADDEARTPVHDPETYETNRAGVYLAGTVCGGLNTSRWFIENGRFHASQIVKDIGQKYGVRTVAP